MGLKIGFGLPPIAVCTSVPRPLSIDGVRKIHHRAFTRVRVPNTPHVIRQELNFLEFLTASARCIWSSESVLCSFTYALHGIRTWVIPSKSPFHVSLSVDLILCNLDNELYWKTERWSIAVSACMTPKKKQRMCFHKRHHACLTDAAIPGGVLCVEQAGRRLHNRSAATVCAQAHLIQILLGCYISTTITSQVLTATAWRP